jgi:hypothetical protein
MDENQKLLQEIGFLARAGQPGYVCSPDWRLGAKLSGGEAAEI